MNVDKFGRHESSVNQEMLRGPKGDGFRLTQDGNYDMKGKLLCNLADAVQDADSVNLRTLKTRTLCFDTNTKVFDVQERRIVNIPTAVADDDAVNRQFVLSEIEKLRNEVKGYIKSPTTNQLVSSIPDTTEEGRNKRK